MLTNKKWWHAALIRALKTVCQTLAGSLPVGITITVKMLQDMDASIVLAVLAWLGTGILAGFASLLTSLAGLPEVEEDGDA